MSPDERGLAQPGEKPIEVGGAAIVYTQPAEVAYTLRREEFDLLCEGEQDIDDKRWRDIFLGIGCTSVVGLLSVILTFDWEKKVRFWLVTLILAAASLASIVVYFYLQKRLQRHSVSSGCQRIKQKVLAYFEERRP